MMIVAEEKGPKLLKRKVLGRRDVRNLKEEAGALLGSVDTNAVSQAMLEGSVAIRALSPSRRSWNFGTSRRFSASTAARVTARARRVARGSSSLLGLTRQTPPTTDHRLDFAC